MQVPVEIMSEQGLVEIGQTLVDEMIIDDQTYDRTYLQTSDIYNLDASQYMTITLVPIGKTGADELIINSP
jgi:hypothetical protein